MTEQQKRLKALRREKARIRRLWSTTSLEDYKIKLALGRELIRIVDEIYSITKSNADYENYYF